MCPSKASHPDLPPAKFDFIVTSVTVTRERADKFAFTVPIADATHRLGQAQGRYSPGQP